MATASFVSAGSRPQLEERILDVTTLGAALFEEQINRVIQRCEKRALGAVAALDFTPWSGDAYWLNRQTPGPDARWVNDTDQPECTYPDPDCAEASYAKVGFPFKTMLICGNVSREAMTRGRPFADVLGLELAETAERLIYTLEKATFQGDLGGASPKEVPGLFELLTAYNGSVPGRPVQVILGEGSVLGLAPGSSTVGVLTLKLLDTVLDELKDGPKVIFVSKAGRRVIRSLLQAQQVFNDTVRVRAGFEVEAYFDAAIIATDGIPDTMDVIDDGAGFPVIDSLDGGSSTAVVAVNTEQFFYAEWNAITIEPLAQCTTQRTKFEGYWDGTTVLLCPEGAAMILNVDPNC